MLHVYNESATVLLITRFHHHDPASIDPKGKIMLPELSRPFLFKHLLGISPNVGVPGRRSVDITSSSPMSPYVTPEDKAYIILKPVHVPLSKRWPKPLQDYFEISELYYINGIVLELMNDETNLSVPNFKSLAIIDNDEDDDNDTTSSSTLPTARLQPSDEYDFSNKSSDVQLWINNLTTSFDYILENPGEDCSTIVRIK